jgi:outer membrane protein assembly factor BamB
MVALAAVAAVGLLSCPRRTAVLDVRSSPDGAVIWLDGDSTGFLTDHVFDKVSAGRHEVRLVGLTAEWSGTVELAAGETKVVEALFPELRRQLAVGRVMTSPFAVGPDGTLYVVCADVDCEYLVALSQDGQVRWSFEAFNSNVSAPAVGPDGSVYVHAGSSLYCLDPVTGHPRWSRALPLYSSSRVSIALGADGRVFAAVERAIAAFSAGGDSLWSRSLSGYWQTGPVVRHDGSVCVAVGESLLCLEPGGDLRWARVVNTDYVAAYALACAPDGAVYFAGNEVLWAIAGDGTLKWTVPLPSDERCAGAAVGPDGAVYVGIRDSLCALNSDGSLRWAYADDMWPDNLDHRWAVPAIAADGTVYSTSSGYGLLAVGADGQLKWRYRCDEQLGGHLPLIADSTLYVGCGEPWGDDALRAYRCPGGAALSGWPMFQHDAQHTGRAQPEPCKVVIQH